MDEERRRMNGKVVRKNVPPKGKRSAVGGKKIDTYGINTIICPYCGYERDSIWDDTENGMEFEEQEEQCNECEKYFLLNCTPFIDCVFTSEKTGEDQMFNRNVPPKGQRPTIGKKVAVSTNTPPNYIMTYIELTVERNRSLYDILCDAYDGYGISGDVGEWIARNESIFAREWLKAKGVI